MARKRRSPAAPRTTVPSSAASVTPSAPGRLIEIDVLGVLGLLLCMLLAYATRNNLNPDGVSYLDLAEALRRGDGGAFVQGYWSPLYPLLIAAVGSVLHGERTSFLLVVHLLNGVIASAGVIAIWRWAHDRRDPMIARAGLVAFVLAAAQPLRIEAVTPDMLLLSIMAWLGYEWLRHGARRWIRVGLLLGLAYLAKTSVWPWLIVATVAQLAIHWRSDLRGAVLRATAVAGLVMSPWIVTTSIDHRSFSMSTAGPLNYCWYLRQCDGRTPDTHEGNHALYRFHTLKSGDSIRVARLDGSGPWTYLPWSDPTAWSQGILTQRSRTPALPQLARYWGRQAWYVVTEWMRPVLLFVLVPLVITHWARGAYRRRPEARHWLPALLGLVGIAQFIAVHAEPRLIAPFVLLFAMAVIEWARDNASAVDTSPTMRIARHVATIAMVVVGLGLSARRVGNELSASALVDQRYLMIDAQLRTEHPDGARRIAVLGYAVPALSDAWRAGARIVAQVPPYSAVAVGKLTPDDQVAEVNRLLGGVADVAWLINPDGRFQWVTLGR